MITLERNNYLKINDFCYLCHLARWGTEDYIYVVAVNNIPEYYPDYGLSIYGYGKTSEEALLMACGQLVTCALKALPFSALKDNNFLDLAKKMIEKDGHIDCPENEPLADLSKEECRECFAEKQSFSVFIDGNKCGALMC